MVIFKRQQNQSIIPNAVVFGLQPALKKIIVGAQYVNIKGMDW